MSCKGWFYLTHGPTFDFEDNLGAIAVVVCVTVVKRAEIRLSIQTSFLYYSFPHIIRTIFRKLWSAPLLPPGLGVRESAHEQFPSLCPQPTQGYTHEHRKFNRSLPPLVAFIPIWQSPKWNLQSISYLCISNTLWFRDKRFWPKFCLRRSWRH